MEEVELELRQESKTNQGRWQEGDEEIGGKALLHRVGGEPREGAREARAVLPADGEDRTQLDHDVEHLALLVVQSEEVGNDDQVSGGGDRKELGEAFHHSKDEGVGERWQVHRGVV